MSTELHIVRMPELPDNGITAEEWLNCIASDPEIQQTNSASTPKGSISASVAGAEEGEILSWRNGWISATTPQKSMIEKMHAIAEHLGAILMTDDGTVIERRKKVSDAPASREPKPTYSFQSLWGASWIIEMERKDASPYDEPKVCELLNHHFGSAPDEYADALNLLKNNARLQFGMVEERAAQRVVKEFHSLHVHCQATPQSSEPHLKFPSFLSPDAAYISPPILLRVSGSSSRDNQETAAHIISHISAFVLESAARDALGNCHSGQPFEFPVSYLEQANSLAQRLQELGYSVEMIRASRGLSDF